MDYFIPYLFIINIISIIIFSYDKYKAINVKQRVPERILHYLEILGGVFGIIITMYIIHHKNSKAKYYLITYIILIIWLLTLYYFRDYILQ
jgi:uncharacterized membrane protein YsdA (DUF1294 family)